MSKRWLFLPLIAGKAWNGETIHKEALGGSEAAVAYLARALAAQGEDITVVTHGIATDVDAVHYKFINEYDPLPETWDVVVSSRWPEVLAQNFGKARKLFWVHDLPGRPFEVDADTLICISQFQSYYYPPNGKIKTEIIGDGVDSGLFTIATPERDPNRLIWTSNPDRGLALAAKIFQELRKRWPDFELHVYGRASVYGWGEDAESPYLPRRQDSENVFLHDPLPRKLLAVELARAWAFFYPTYWPETYCMATLEAQAMGTPVVASPLAALNETVKGGILSYDFLNSISQLRNKRRWEKLSEAGREYAKQNTWEEIATKWRALI